MLTTAGASSTVHLRSLTKRYGSRTLFEDLTTSLQPGLTGVMGPSGVGKTTLLLVVAGLEAPTSGRVDQMGLQATSHPFTWIMQSANLLPARSAIENVALPLLAAGDRFDSARTRALHALAAVGLTGVGDHETGRLSGGERQRIAVARALTSPAHLVLADEPTASLGPDHRALVIEALRVLGRSGRLVLVATHDPAVADACDRVLDLGRPDGWT